MYTRIYAFVIIIKLDFGPRSENADFYYYLLIKTDLQTTIIFVSNHNN